MKRLIVGIALAAAALLSAAPAQADVDTDFTNELHIYGIYGQKDYNAWIGKITCKRLNKGLDKDANMSAAVRSQSAGERTAPPSKRGSSLVPRLRLYCPDKLPILAQAAH